MRRHRVEEPAHSRVLHDGDPPEQLYVAHRDGSFSAVTIRVDSDHLDVTLRPALTHGMHLHGVDS